MGRVRSHLPWIVCLIAAFLAALLLPLHLNSSSAAPMSDGLSQAVPTTFSGALGTCDPTYNRAFNVSTVSATGTNVFYEFQEFTVNLTGVYTLSMTGSTIPDAHASIYRDSFNPAATLTNIVFVDDDSGPGVNPGFLNITLDAGVTYILVTSTLSNGLTGSYTWTLSGAGAYTLGTNSITPTCPTATPTITPTQTLTPPPSISFSGDLGTCDPTYNRAFNVSTVSATGTNVFYEFQEFTVNLTGVYTLSMTGTTIPDAHASIYRDSFNPAATLTNIVFVDDDSGPGVNPGFLNITLDAGVTYILVTSTLSNGLTGSYTWTLSGAGAYTLGTNSILLGCSTATPTSTPSSTATSTATPSATSTSTDTPTSTTTASATSTFTGTASPSATSTPTETSTGTTTASATSTFTGTASPSATSTPTETSTSTATFTGTVSPSATSTSTDTPTATDPSTSTGTASPSATSTLGDITTNTATSTDTGIASATSTNVTVTSTSVMTTTASATPPPSEPLCTTPLPVGSIQGRLLSLTQGLFSPDPRSTTDVLLPAGSSWWIIDTAPGYYRLWIACAATPVWVSAFLVTPNYDAVWRGSPLP